jgi:mono/diheme cytochrome c family protein
MRRKFSFNFPEREKMALAMRVHPFNLQLKEKAMITIRMRALIVMTASIWMLAPLAGTASAQGGKVQQGEKIFTSRQCTACHTVHGKGGEVGPDLTKVGDRRDETWLKKFLPAPASVKPGVIMPPFQGTPEELDALIAYLLSLK